MYELANDPYKALALPLDLGRPGGMRVAVKDCIDIAGFPTRAGSAAFDDAPAAATHAKVVGDILAAGCHIIGKSRMHELAFGMTGVNEACGTAINPAWPDRIPGGSSSGSAVAVAAGLADFAVGTDTGGSIRQPACCCGVAGFKPSFGRISRQGATPAYSSLDCIGPFARDPDMLIRAMVAMDPSFVPVSAPAVTRLIAVDVKPSAEVQSALDLVDYATFEKAPLPSLEAAFKAGMTLIGHETAAAFGYLLAQNASLGKDIRGRLAKAAEIPLAALHEAETIREAFTAEVDALLKDHDAILLPAMPTPPPTLIEALDPQTVLGLTLYIRPFNLSGHPVVMLPLMTREGLPAGLQLVGRKGEDAILLAIAAQLWLRHRLSSASPSTHLALI